MIKFLFFLTGFTFSSLIAYEATLESKKKFAVEAGYCGMWHSPLKSLEFINKLGDKFPLDSKIRFNYVSGLRALLELNQGPKNSIEAVYTGLFHWRNDASNTDINSGLWVPTNPYTNTDWTNFYYFHYQYASELNSGELSYWRHVTPRYIDYFSFSWLLGLRYIDFRDSLKMNNRTGEVGDTASVKVVNQMFGGQAGLEMQFNATRRFTWAIQIKGGAYADFVSRKTVFNDLGNTVEIINSKQKRVEKDYTLELIPYLMYRLNPIYFKLAYDRVILFNPVFAPLQLDKNKSVDEVYRHNYINFQVVYASIGFYW
ncbi:MAG: hypothetical protein FJZ59_06070 [Chlamydiae bacterium]|jgi:hypothetical protein|nr:hypothetical protein [Chlamydiota bacterium]